MHEHLSMRSIHVPTHIHIHMPHTYAHDCAGVMCIRVCISFSLYVYMCIYLTYIYIYIHTHVYT